MEERDIFIKVIQTEDPDKGAALVEELCGQDQGLRQRVEELLVAHGRAVSFLESPPADLVGTVDNRPISEHPGTVIGSYKLLQQIGEGGMGVVFMAEQTEPIQRTVALKIIKPGMDTRQVIARFEAERQAVAMMDHPNIAKVLDAGTTDSGRPYFVMELVKGVPITKYCDEKQLSLRERLQLFMQVCQAVQHAHQKGIIHRDIKPNNVLVAEYDDHAIPKVIDFGVAKATAQKLTERTMFTEFGQVLGTMEYMSPEQSKFNQLDIDTRSDIYSLGVLLYELLAGSTPFEGKQLKEAAFDEMLRIIREEEPPKPSTRLSSSETLPSIAANRHVEPARLSKDVRGDLDWIVMKALEKDRNRRYETASGFAADIQRHLHDEPVEAGPPSPAYRFRKFAKRNKGPVVTASLILMTLIVGVLGTTIGLIRAEKAREAESEQRRTAETREAESRAILSFVNDKIFAAAGPEGQDGGLGREVTLRKAIEAALPFVETSFRNQPNIEANLRMTLGTAFVNLGAADKATQQYQTARMLFTKCGGPDHRDTLRSMRGLATSYAALGRYADALRLREEILAMQKSKLGPDNPDVLDSMTRLATSYEQSGRIADALKLREETLPLCKAKLGPDDILSLSVMAGVANCYEVLGRHADALKLREETVTLYKVTLGPAHPHTLLAMNNLANSYSYLGRQADALKLQEETLAMQKTKLGPDHPDTLLSMCNLANQYTVLGRHGDAVQLGKETVALYKTKFGPDHPNTLRSMFNLGISYEQLGGHAEALKLREETLALQKIKLGPDHVDTMESMAAVASSLTRLGRDAEAWPIIVECEKRAEGKIDHRLMKRLLTLRFRHFQTTKDAAGCRTTAEMREKLERTDASGLYNAACFRAVTAAVIAHDPNTPVADASRLARKEADRAMASLNQAVAAGYSDFQFIRKDADLEVLRDRDDFQKLVAKLETEADSKELMKKDPGVTKDDSAKITH